MKIGNHEARGHHGREVIPIFISRLVAESRHLEGLQGATKVRWPTAPKESYQPFTVTGYPTLWCWSVWYEVYL